MDHPQRHFHPVKEPLNRYELLTVLVADRTYVDGGIVKHYPAAVIVGIDTKGKVESFNTDEVRFEVPRD